MKTFVKPRFNCDLNFVMKSSCKRLLPQVTTTKTSQLDFLFVFKLLQETTRSLLHINNMI